MDRLNISEWMDAYSGDSSVWYVKRLSGNDTLANGSHQAGPYIPKDLLFDVFPALNRPGIKNPDVRFELCVHSHDEAREVRAIWYNNRLHENPENGRNETRVTGFGGQSSALLDPDSTGALTIFAFRQTGSDRVTKCEVWLCANQLEEELVEERVGPVEPGKGRVWPPKQADLFNIGEKASCWLAPDEIPEAWLVSFPSGVEIIRKAIALRDDRRLSPDQRLVKRRECEFEMFRSVEQAVEMPNITAGFSDIDSFIARAQTILQRRKARSGHSLELHAKAIFLEEELIEGQHFSHQPESEPGKKPDFLFPSAAAYKDPTFPSDRLRMLAVKTSCRDRWRQVINEADRIPVKHLLTLQEGVSEAQFREMCGAGVKLVVPDGIIRKFAKPIQPHLQSLATFIANVKADV